MIIVTCGPSSEPIDAVRSLTNFSTGELGALLCAELHHQGFQVICLRSVTATYPLDPGVATVIPFTTNDDLTKALEKLSQQEAITALFHAAALCDYRVEKVTTVDGVAMSAGKIPTNAGSLTMTLQPTMKVISKLRAWFPDACLVGWKYEVDGTASEADAKAEQQIEKYQLDASIANGSALGNGFDFIAATGEARKLASKLELVRFLAEWVSSKRSS